MNQVEQPERALTYQGGRPREEDILTRRKLSLWDRSKWLLLLVVIWLLLVWSLMSNNPLVGFADAVRIQVREGWWVFILIGLELIHQIHYYLSERSAAYHQFWMKNVWGRWERFTDHKMSAWTKFRITRLISWIVIIAVVAIVTGKIIHAQPLDALLRIPQIIWGALPFVVQIVFTLFFVVAQFALMFWFLSRGGVDVYYPDDIKTRFSDVWGQDHVLERVKENIIFLENPELVEDRGGYVPGGILLWGPPGTGKTLMAEAVAGETGKPYVFVDPGAFINMFFGVGVLKVKGLFRKLRKLSLRYGGVIVFFDEADSLGNRGIAMGSGVPGGGNASPFSAGCHGMSYLSPDTQWMLTTSAVGSSLTDPESTPGTRRYRQIMGMGMNGGGGGGMGTLQALLTELSGLKKPRGFMNRVVRRALGMRPKPPPHYRILVMMATNMPSALDEALLRPGRIDRIYRVGYPSKEGRVRTYEGYLERVSHELTSEQVDKLATMTPQATGASIKDLVNEALIVAIRDGRDVITYPDVLKAKRMKSLGPTEDVEYIQRERHAVAVHEACHAVAAYRTRGHMEIDLATIERGAGYLGMVASILPEEQLNVWRSEFQSDIIVSLASLAGERMFFDNDSSRGVSGDLDNATSVAAQMEAFYGMGSTISSLSSGQRYQIGTPGAQGKGTQEDTQTQARRLLADRIEDHLSTLFAQTAELLRENERHILAIAHALETHKTFSGEDVTAIFEGTRGPLVDGTVYSDDAFIERLREYHLAAKQAHQKHSTSDVPLPSPERAYAVTTPGAYLYGNGSGSAYGTMPGTGTGGLGSGNGSSGPLGAPTYDDPPEQDEPQPPDDSSDES